MVEEMGDSTERFTPMTPTSATTTSTTAMTAMTAMSTALSAVRNDLPDILNSHLPPPPYSPLVHSSASAMASMSAVTLLPSRVAPPPPPPPPLPTGRPPLPSRRILSAPTAIVSHCSRPNYLRPNCAVSESETSASKSCLTCSGVSIRWFILIIAFIGLLCAVIGTIVGVLRTTGREHLTLALLMIGVGIILITVSVIAWRMTSNGSSWRSIIGLHHELHHQQSHCNGSAINDTSRRFVPRVPAPYGRTGAHHHPYGAMFYPEFPYRPPPPSYQASMQEYRLRLLLLERSSSHSQSTSLSPVSPPPTYRSSAASSLTGTLTRPSTCNTMTRGASRPPSYRVNGANSNEQVVSLTQCIQANASLTVPQTKVITLTPCTVSVTTAITPTLTASQPHSSSTQSHCLHNQCHTQSMSQSKSQSMTQPSTPSNTQSHHDINRVTILQTTNTSQVCTPNGVNIVAITPTPIATNTPTQHKVQILAHV